MERELFTDNRKSRSNQQNVSFQRSQRTKGHNQTVSQPGREVERSDQRSRIVQAEFARHTDQTTRSFGEPEPGSGLQQICHPFETKGGLDVYPQSQFRRSK